MSQSARIQFCHICEKPFTTENAYTRHTTYCRKAQGRHKRRSQACAACRSAKAKCSFEEQCQRCKKHGLSCIYGSKKIAPIANSRPAEIPGTTAAEQEDVATEFESAEPIIDDLQKETRNSCTTAHPPAATLGDDDDAFRDSVFNDEVSDLLGIDGTLIGSTLVSSLDDDDDAHIMSSQQLSQQQQLSLEPSATSSSSQQRLMHEIQGRNTYDDRLWSKFFFPSDPYASWSVYGDAEKWVMQPIYMPSSVSQTHASRVVRMLRSFPRMMLRRETFPPFIHTHQGHDLPEPIANCMSIAQIFCSRNTVNGAFVWRTIRAEQDRLVREMHRFSAKDLLAALQAYFVYMIMRAEDDTGYTSRDVEMISSMKALCAVYLDHCGIEDLVPESRNDRTTTWSLWAFKEGRRRSLLIYYLINRVFNIFIGHDCPLTNNFMALPLPSPRHAWEARSDSVWSAAYADSFETDRLMTFGDLVKETRFSTKRLDEWHCSIDYLGLILESAADLVV
ncbi:hypothetical protein, variant [Exophiala oligosperma]|uniref:Zn(2)-C6 fungal-type domain-containing protein n=1 Tax=Exophiala oligosperma TaxID=215243 RepID=A0A0D2DZ05_9EURO|nr:hypothetical protein, variant [Exophiala oligosperma]KIW48328.1 hypothetical protein, variant [Exophiala oligosperma]